MNEVLTVIRRRRSVRIYKEEQLQEHELQTILEAGLWAPSGHNSQPWHLTVIQETDLIRHMSEISTKEMAKSPIEWVAHMGRNGRSIFYNAPTVIIVSGKQEEFLDPLVDCSAAVQNLLLAAESLDIGSCWIGLVRFFFSKEEELGKLQLPVGYKPFYAVCLGYKVRANGQGPVRASGTVSYIR